MSTNFVLIDFENVQPESIAALGRDQFRVIVFIGANQTKIPFEIASTLQQMGDSAEYVKISGNGKNALDFHIAFAIGQLSVKDPMAYFHIISKDAGFDPLIQHLKLKKISIARWSKIEDIPLLKRVQGEGKKTTKIASTAKPAGTPSASISNPQLVSKVTSNTSPEKPRKVVNELPQTGDTAILAPQRKVTCPTCKTAVPAVVGQIDFVCQFCHGAFRY